MKKCLLRMPSWFNTCTSTSTSMSTGFNEHVVVRGLWGRAVRSRWDVGSRHLLRGSRCPAAKACPWTSRPLCRWNVFMRFAWRSTYTTWCKMMPNASAYEVAARYQGCSCVICVFKVTKYSRPLHCFFPANLQQRFRHFTDDVRHGCRSLLQLSIWSPVDGTNESTGSLEQTPKL